MSFEYPPFTIGGAGSYAEHITSELAKLGHEIHVIVPDSHERNTGNNIIIHSIPVLRKPFLHIPSFWFSLFTKYNQIQKEVGKFDVVHGNAISDLTLSNLQVLVPRAVTVHHLARTVTRQFPVSTKLQSLTGEMSITPFVEKKVLDQSNRIIAVSNFTKDSIISEYNISEEKIVVVKNGTNMYENPPSQREIDAFKRAVGVDGYFVFLFVGRLNDPRKNLSFLLTAFGIMLQNRCETSKLLLVGSGDQLNIRDIASSLGISKNLVFLGHVDDAILKLCYYACDVFVSPSLIEGFGLTIIESMAAGKPVIAFAGGAVGELVKDEINGRVLKILDPLQFAQAMIFFKENPCVIKNIGHRNREIAIQNFSWKKSAQNTLAVFNDLLSE